MNTPPCFTGRGLALLATFLLVWASRPAVLAQFAPAIPPPGVPLNAHPPYPQPGAGQNQGLPPGETKFTFSAYARNVKALPPLVADFQLGTSTINGNGVIKDGKITGTLNDSDQLQVAGVTRWLTANITGGTYSTVGDAQILTLTVVITNSSHPAEEARVGLIGTLVIQDSPYLLSNGQPDDTVGLGGWNGDVRTHIHGYNNADPGPRTDPPTGGFPKGGQWAKVEIGKRPTNITGLWKSDFGPVTLYLQNGLVTGTWDQGSGYIGKIFNGRFDAPTGTLTYEFYQEWNKVKGSATFKLANDGQRLAGSYTGTSGSGGWNLTR